MKLIATALLSVALFTADVLSAQTATTTTDTKKAQDPASLSWRKNRKLAKKLLKKGNNEAAIPYLEAGAGKKPKKVYFAENLSKADYAIRDYKGANKWYNVLVQKDSAKHKKPAYLFELGRTQKSLGLYEEASATFAKYRKMAKDDDESMDMKKRATRELEGAQKGIFFRDSVPNKAYKVKHLGENINHAGADYSPMLKGNNSLYFASQKDNSYSRIMKSVRSGKDWGRGEDISDNINTANIEVGNPTFTQDGNTMYYTQCMTDAGTSKSKCQIYKSTLAGGVWDKGVSAGAQVNDPLYSNTQPAVGKNKDGEDVIYFISDRNAGKGLDIFYSKINATDGSLAKPRSAGSQINSRGDEMSPYFDFKSKTLYFSSNGWINIGGMDVFKASWDQNGEWLEPENLGTPVNSSADDYYFSLNEMGTLGFVVSNRTGSMGSMKNENCCDDIYQVETTKLYLAVRGNVFEEVDNYRILSADGKVALYDERNGIELGATNVSSGAYFFDLEPKRGYKLITRKEGFMDAVLSFTSDNSVDNDTFQYDLFLKKKASDNPLIGRVIGKIYYDYDQARLRADSRDTLRKVMDIMNQYPNIVLEVGAHTDGKGTEDYNVALSKRRADAVMNYYIYEKKINAKRLVAKPYGTSMPVASNTTPDGKDDPNGRAMNRRTEFKIIDELKGADTVAAKGKTKEKTTTTLLAAPKEEKPVSKKATTKTADLPKEKKEEAKPAKVVKKEVRIGDSSSSEAKVTKSAPQPVAMAAEPKKESAPAPKVEVKREEKKIAEEGYKAAPAKTVLVKGKVYTEKGGRRMLMTEGTVFLTSEESGFQQKVFYVKNDGTYSFDLSRSSVNSFKLTARKDKYESNEVVFTLDDIKADNKPIDLVVKSK